MIFTTILNALTTFKTWVLKPENRWVMWGLLILVLILILLKQCNDNGNLKTDLDNQKAETTRISNNYEASLDTLDNIRLDNGKLIGQKAGYELTIDEAKIKYSKLLADFKIEKNKPPITIVHTEFVIRDSIREVPVIAVLDSNGLTAFVFKDTVIYSEGNWRKIEGKIPYFVLVTDSAGKLIPDSMQAVITKVVPGLATLVLEQGISLTTGLFKDNDTKKIMIKVESSYPGLTFTKIEGASILEDKSKENKKLLRELRKPISIGINLSYGVSFNQQTKTLGYGPSIGVGIQYSPKWLQFGK